MKYLRLISDIHLDFDIAMFSRTRPFNAELETAEQKELRLKQTEMDLCWLPAPMPEDADTALLIAGDLWTDRRFLTRKYSDGESWMQKVAQQFKYVLFVLGNHDYWHANLTIEPQACAEEIIKQGLENVFILEKSLVVLDQVKFVGGTLWTDFKKHDPMTMYAAKEIMVPDYMRIKVGTQYRKLRPEDLYSTFTRTRDFIFASAKRDYPEQKVIVMTHMAPSEMSIDARWKQSQRDLISNYYYFSNLDNEIMDAQNDIDLWVHGHTHAVIDYDELGVRVVCNPRGYAGHKLVPYDPYWRVEI